MLREYKSDRCGVHGKKLMIGSVPGGNVMNANVSLAALGVLALCSVCGSQAAGGSLEAAASAHSQPAPVTAIQGPYRAIVAPASAAPRFKVFRPESLDRFPRRDTLPVVVWGNGGCVIDTPVYKSLLLTIASHGFLVVTTRAVSVSAAPAREATADDLRAAIRWAERENIRADSPLRGRIAASRIAVMGQSCGGSLAIELGGDPRVSTIGVFDYGTPNGDALTRLHGPVLLISGGERDFMQVPAKATYDAIDHLPAFFGSLRRAGHAGTVMQPGGGAFANVAVNWLLWQLKGDRRASRMFVGRKCGLCANPNWVTAAKRL